jgi:8-oxo-dGTP diphosphatase
MTTQIAIAVVEHEGRFLIGQRPQGVPLAGLWEFPGGKVEPGESPTEAAVRECLEETGLVVRVVGEYPSHLHEYAHGQVELRFYRCELAATGQPKPPYGWVLRSDLKKYEFPAGNRGLLQELLGHEF